MQKIKIALLLFIVLAGAACTKDLTELNEDPKNPANVTSQSLFTNAERSFARTHSSTNVNLNVFRLVTQYWQQVTYTSESRYFWNSRNIAGNLWTAMYRDVLRDLQESKTKIPSELKSGDPAMDAAIKKNQTAIIDILQVYAYYYLVTTYGNIPYSEALDIDNVFPKFDDQRAVYNDLLRRLDEDIAALNATVDHTGFGTADIIYGNDANANNILQWQRFANSIKLKMGMTIADVDNAKAKSVVESAVSHPAKVFQSNQDNALFAFLGFPPNTNPVWEDLVQSGRQDYVAALPIIDTLSALSDPRLALYFTEAEGGGYAGLRPGYPGSYGANSKPDEQVARPTFPGIFLDYSEVEFLLAEAVERGYAVGGTAAGHYHEAIRASILFWGGTPEQATAYIANPQVNYLTATGDWKKKIGMQKWIAMYNRGWDSWIEWRRLDNPRLAVARPTSNGTGGKYIPRRMTYPVNEQNYNTKNYDEAAAAIGGDVMSTRLFWDVTTYQP